MLTDMQRFKHWEDSTHVLTQVFPAEPPQRQPVTSMLVRCDVTTGACEEAPVRGSNGTSPVISW